MERYLTLSRQDNKFFSVLTGRFSRTEVAIPTRSLEVSTIGEKVTFQIRSRPDLNAAEWLTAIVRLFRWNLLGLSFGPLLVVATMTELTTFHGTWVLALLALMAFHSGLFALNDYVDHVRGLDRVSDLAGSRVIQNGILPAYVVLKIAVIALTVSLVFAAPVFIESPKLLLVGMAAFALGVFGYSFARSGWRRLLLGGISVFSHF